MCSTAIPEIRRLDRQIIRAGLAPVRDLLLQRLHKLALGDFRMPLGMPGDADSGNAEFLEQAGLENLQCAMERAGRFSTAAADDENLVDAGLGGDALQKIRQAIAAGYISRRDVRHRPIPQAAYVRRRVGDFVKRPSGWGDDVDPGARP